jgi:CRISPR-associated protein Cas1
MATLYVQEQGASVRKRDQQVLVTKDGQTLREVPLAKLDQVVVMGRGVQVSTALLVDLLGRGIPVTLTNQHGSRHYATLSAGPSRFGELRSRQMELVHTDDRALDLARRMIHAKLINQRTVLVATKWAAGAAAITQIDAALAGVTSASTIDMVRGYEGAAAAAYFGAWRVSLPPGWQFAGRSFYPPPDPINALLSFGYTLALHDVLTAVQITGLDPYLGTFHALEAGRPSLALDLLEEFRPLLVDRLVLDIVRTNALARAQFERPSQRSDAVYLDKSGRALLIDRYEAVLRSTVKLASGERTPFRRVVLLQAQAVARVVRGEQAQYTGFTP